MSTSLISETLLTSSDQITLGWKLPRIERTCSVEILLACISAELKYFAQRSVAGKCEFHSGQNWILDSGASVHFTNDRKDFTDYDEISNGPQVQTATETVSIVGSGTVYITFNLKGVKSYLRLYPVFHIPKIQIRLLSMGEFLLDGYKMEGDHMPSIFMM